MRLHGHRRRVWASWLDAGESRQPARWVCPLVARSVWRCEGRLDLVVVSWKFPYPMRPELCELCLCQSRRLRHACCTFWPWLVKVRGGRPVIGEKVGLDFRYEVYDKVRDVP